MSYSAEGEEGHLQRKASLCRRILAVQADVARLPKRGRVKFGRTDYAYFQEADLLEVLKPALAEHGLCVFPNVSGVKREGGMVCVELTLTLVDTETGASVTTLWPNIALDEGDKSYNMAYTGALRYALQKTFLVATEDVDHQERAPAESEDRALTEVELARVAKRLASLDEQRRGLALRAAGVTEAGELRVSSARRLREVLDAG